MRHNLQLALKIIATVIIASLSTVMLVGAFEMSEAEKSEQIRIENRETINQSIEAQEALQSVIDRLEKENADRREFECSITPGCEGL